MRTVFLSFAALLIVAQFGLAGAEQVIDTNDSSGAIAINTNEPSITPDSFFWGIKNTIDKVSLALTFNPQSKAEKGLEIAQERLLEFRKMAEEGKISEAEKAKQSHDDFIEKARIASKEIRRSNKTEEMAQQIEIEKKVEELEKISDKAENNIKVKIQMRGNLTAEQKALIESFIVSMQNRTGSLKIEIERNKEKIKIEIKQKTGRSETEIEEEIEGLEEEHNLTGVKTAKAIEKIADAKEEIAKLEAAVLANNITDNSVLVLLNNSREKLADAESALNASKYDDAYGLANAAGHLAENARDKIESAAGKEEGKYSRDYMIKNLTACNVKSDCNAEFSACGCNYVCRNKYHEPLADCARACSKEEINRSVQDCKCKNNACVAENIENKEHERETKVCIQVITPARNERTGECREFPTPCSVPEGWEKVGGCSAGNPSSNISR